MNPRLLVVGEALVDIVSDPTGGTAEHVGGSPANVDVSNDERQAARVRLLKAAIEKRRAEQAAARANQGER